MAYQRPVLKFEDFITITVESDKAFTKLLGLNEHIKRRLMVIYQQIGDSASKRMRYNVTAPKPYGTTSSRIVRRAGRVYQTIGYRTKRLADGPVLYIGAIKGTSFGRQLATVHDQGQWIFPKKGPFLIYPPEGSPARDASGEQIMNATQTRKKFDEQWDFGDKIWVRNKGENPQVAFIKARKVFIPPRFIISGEYDFIKKELERKVPTTIRQSLQLEFTRTS